MLFNIIKGIHIIAVIAWMAGLLYLPRLFAYHTRAEVGSEMDKTFQTMERKLLTIIMNPALVGVILFGFTLIYFDGIKTFSRPWMIVKIIFVLSLVSWHIYLSISRKILASGRRVRSERFWRAMNELPFLAAIVIVLSVTTKFGG